MDDKQIIKELKAENAELIKEITELKRTRACPSLCGATERITALQSQLDGIQAFERNNLTRGVFNAKLEAVDLKQRKHNAIE